MTVRYSKRALLILAAALTWLWAYAPAEAAGNPFEKLSGDWIGEGTVKLKDGKVKTVTCKVNYKVAGNNLT